MKPVAPAPTAPAYLSPQAVAERLGVSRMHVYRLITSGRMRAFNRGNGTYRPVWRISVADLEKYEQLGATDA